MALRFVAGCLRRIVVLAGVAAAAALAWHNRAELRDLWYDVRPGAEDAAVVSPALADRAERKVSSLASDSAPERVTLSEAEVQSLLEHRLAPLLPTTVGSPRVRLRDGRVQLTGRVPTAHFSQVGPLRNALGFLPDTAELVATGQIIPLDDRRAGLQVASVSAAHIPLPERMIPGLLVSLGRTDQPRLPADAVAVPLPPGVRAAYVAHDSLVLLGRGANARARTPTDRP